MRDDPAFKKKEQKRLRDLHRKQARDPAFRKKENARTGDYKRRKRATDPAFVAMEQARLRELEERRQTDPAFKAKADTRARERQQAKRRAEAEKRRAKAERWKGGSSKEAQSFLRRVLAKGPQLAKVIVQEAKIEGISERTLRRARKDLGVKVEKLPEYQGAWTWRLPPTPKQVATFGARANRRGRTRK
jgi:predicted pyridoxine 5'-phosphate oxidase superfamily flavin-nucleotide-binding protein